MLEGHGPTSYTSFHPTLLKSHLSTRFSLQGEKPHSSFTKYLKGHGLKGGFEIALVVIILLLASSLKSSQSVKNAHGSTYRLSCVMSIFVVVVCFKSSKSIEA